MHRRPQGGAIGILEVPTECLVSLNDRKLKILPARKSFPRPESLGRTFVSHPWDEQGAKQRHRPDVAGNSPLAMRRAVSRMLFSHWYTMPTPLVKGAGNMSRSAAVAATFWLALVKAGSCHSTRSIATVWPASSVDSRWHRLISLASTAHL
jgi:hypothetical protein